MEATMVEGNMSTTNSTTDELSFQIEKEVLLDGLKIVERATAQKGLQPVLANIMLDAVDKTTINLYATDFDLSMITTIKANVHSKRIQDNDRMPWRCSGGGPSC